MCALITHVSILIKDSYEPMHVMYLGSDVDCLIWFFFRWYTQKPRYPVFVCSKNYFLHLLLILIPRVFVELYIMILYFPYSYSVITSMLSMYAHTLLKSLNSLDIFYWKISKLLQTPKCSFWSLYLHQGITKGQIWVAPNDNSIWYYPIFKSKDDVYVEHSRSSSIFCSLDICNSFVWNLWFIFLKPDKNPTIPSFSSWIKVWDPHSNLFTFLVPLSDTTFLLTYRKHPRVIKAPDMALNDKVLFLAIVLYLQTFLSRFL